MAISIVAICFVGYVGIVVAGIVWSRDQLKMTALVDEVANLRAEIAVYRDETERLREEVAQVKAGSRFVSSPHITEG